MVARRLLESPRPLREVRETVPEGIERAAARALAKAPADRFATAAELARALDEAGTAPAAATVARPQPAISAVAPRHHRRVPLTLALAIGFVIGLGVLFGWLRSHGNVEATGPGATRLLAVLPFENLGDSTVEYFADGITDEVRGKLATLPGLQVIASGSAAQYKRSGKLPQQIAQELGVRYLLTGKIRWEKGAGGASRVRVSPELVEIAGGTPTTRWQQPFDASLTDVFQVQADIAGRVAEALDVALGSGEKQVLAERPTRNLPAYDAYLKGEEVSRGLTVGDPATLRRALAYYEQAIAIDSGFAAAWAARARVFAIRYSNSVPDPALARSALESAERARALAPSRPEPYLALAEYQRSITGDPARVLEYAEQGLKLAPRDVNLLVIAALANQAAGRWEEAARLLGRAQAIDPRSVVTGWRLARSLLFLRQHSEALAACERGLELDPTHLGLLETRVMVHLAQGDLPGARQAVERGLTLVDPAALVAYVATYYDLFWVLDQTRQALLFQLSPASFDGDRGSWGLALGGAYALRGDDRRAHAYADSARAALEDQVRNNPSDAQLHALLGVAYAYLGRKADAIREGKWGVEALPTSQDGFTGPYIEHQLARIYVILGEPDEAIAHLEAVLRVPYYLSKGWLRIDPTFDPIRKHPRFIKLVEGTA